MKKLIVYMILSFLSATNFGCNSENMNTEIGNNISGAEKIEVYYFHFSHRCKTCVAVEAETKKALNELYSEKMKSGKIKFTSVNMDEKAGEDLAKKMKVSGQTLLFVQADKRTNLTNDAFMFALTNPSKLKAKIKIAVDKMIK